MSLAASKKEFNMAGVFGGSESYFTESDDLLLLAEL